MKIDLWSPWCRTRPVFEAPDTRSPFPFAFCAGAFDTQGIVTLPIVRLMKHLGTLSPEQLHTVVRGLCLWLGIEGGF